MKKLQKSSMKHFPLFSSIFSIFLVFSICFSLNVLASEGSLKMLPEISGWKKSDRVSVFSPETLYDYINGAAESYLSYDFQELTVGEYSHKNGSSVITEIYRHKTPHHSFGIYSQEKPSEGKFLDIGAQGYLEGTILNFLDGDYYVKINCYDAGDKTEEILDHFGKIFSKNLGGQGRLPKILRCFPDKGKVVNSERFIARDFLGYGFLHSAFTADYELNDKSFKLFIIAGAKAKECGDMVKQYLEKVKSPGIEVKEGKYILEDPYHGEISLSWQGKYIWGVQNLAEEENRVEYMKLMELSLQKTSYLQAPTSKKLKDD